MKNKILFIFLLLLSNWIWKIFSISPFVAISVACITVVIFLFTEDVKSKYLLILSCLGIILLSIIQVKYTNPQDLTAFSNDQIRIRDMRLREYPTYRIPIAYWLEQRKESVIYFRLKSNLAESLDTNLYFFANHPRSRVGVNEFEKFHFVFIPFFILGILSELHKRKFFEFFLLFFIPISILTIVGNRSEFGPILLFPFFVINIYYGARSLWKK